MPENPPNSTQDAPDEPEGTQEPPEPDPPQSEGDPEPENANDDDGDTFDRAYVEKLRKEAGDYRVRAKRADALAAKLLETTIADATRGILADPTDLRANLANETELLDDDGDPDADKIKNAAQELVKTKPHLGDRRPKGEVDQGARDEPASVNLASMLRERAG